MTEQPANELEERGTTIVYRPDAEGGLKAAPADSGDYRDGLRSRRWDAAPLENPEADVTDPRVAVAAIVVLAIVTLVVIIIGYGVLDLWSLPV